MYLCIPYIKDEVHVFAHALEVSCLYVAKPKGMCVLCGHCSYIWVVYDKACGSN